jgi:carboxylesterase
MTINDQSYYVAGGRIGVLLMHSLYGTPTEMRFVANGMARAGYTVYCPQLTGHGGSQVDIKQTTWQERYASAEAALARLRKECDVVIVGGLSTGAALTLLLAARHPEDVHGTALIAPTFGLNGRLVPWYDRLFRTISNERIRDVIRKALFSGDGSAAVLEHPLLVNAVRAEVGNIRQPALIIHPRGEDRADLDQAWYLQRNLNGLVDMVVLDDSRHIVTADRQRNLAVERAAAFVGSIAKTVRGTSAKAPDRVSMPACAAA